MDPEIHYYWEHTKGYGYPEDNQEEYNKYIEENASEEMKKYIDGEITEKPYKQRYYLLEKDNLIAKYRMKKWWNTDKIIPFL